MISFIVIGRNEGWKLTKCFESILSVIKKHALRRHEIIYIDSKSIDDSVERAKSFNKIKIFRIIGECNAAIARNIGAAEAKGENLFFIDGDMEINEKTFSLLYNEDDGMKYEFCSGNFIDYNYSKSGELISQSYHKKMDSNQLEYTTGGLFMIKKSLWEMIGGMKNKLRRSQDWDLSFRLANRGYFLNRIKETLAIHHMISYRDKNRIWKMFFNGDKYYRIVILRENLFNRFQWKHFIRINYTFFLLIGLILSSILLKYPYLLILYLGFIIFRSIIRKPSSIRALLSDVFLIFIYEISIIGAFLFFWPKNQKVEYELVNQKI